MNNESSVSRLQHVVRASGLDGWLLYDFRGLNPFPVRLLNLGHGILTRRWFLHVPAAGPGDPHSSSHRGRSGGGKCCRMKPSSGKSCVTRTIDDLLRETLHGGTRIATNTARAAKYPT
jgi:hypothetical protein